MRHKRICASSMRHKKICVSNFAENEAQISDSHQPQQRLKGVKGGAAACGFFHYLNNLMLLQLLEVALQRGFDDAARGRKTAAFEYRLGKERIQNQNGLP